MSYNLVDEKWIPVLYNNGKADRVGIRTALAQAHQIRGIAASNPMDRLAILRFLPTLLYRCKGSVPKARTKTRRLRPGASGDLPKAALVRGDSRMRAYGSVR